MVITDTKYHSGKSEFLDSVHVHFVLAAYRKFIIGKCPAVVRTRKKSALSSTNYFTKRFIRAAKYDDIFDFQF